jgi:fluoroquinolone transport system permease protein
MDVLRAIKVLGPIDALSVRRDPVLRWVMALPLLIALLVRFFLPAVTVRLEETLRISLSGFYPAIAGYALLSVAPALCGMVIGFLLLDERDDRTQLALRVTPLPLTSYLAYRLALPMLMSLVVTPVTFPIAGLAEPRPDKLLLAALAASPIALLMALALATFADNKVQGFALVKASGIFLNAPLVAYFVRSEWQLAFGIIPTYWPAKTLWAFQTAEANAWLYLLAGLVYQALLLMALLRRFNKMIAR